MIFDLIRIQILALVSKGSHCRDLANVRISDMKYKGFLCFPVISKSKSRNGWEKRWLGTELQAYQIYSCNILVGAKIIKGVYSIGTSKHVLFAPLHTINTKQQNIKKYNSKSVHGKTDHPAPEISLSPLEVIRWMIGWVI